MNLEFIHLWNHGLTKVYIPGHPILPGLVPLKSWKSIDFPWLSMNTWWNTPVFTGQWVKIKSLTENGKNLWPLWDGENSRDPKNPTYHRLGPGSNDPSSTWDPPTVGVSWGNKLLLIWGVKLSKYRHSWLSRMVIFRNIITFSVTKSDGQTDLEVW